MPTRSWSTPGVLERTEKYIRVRKNRNDFIDTVFLADPVRDGVVPPLLLGVLCPIDAEPQKILEVTRKRKKVESGN